MTQGPIDRAGAASALVEMEPADPIRTIVAATDFSDSAAVALDRAVELAGGSGAKIVAVHALTFHPLPAGGPQLHVLPDDFESQLRDASLKRLEEMVEELAKRGVDASAELDVGNSTAQVVVDAAESHGADLIVSGTRGLTGFSHLLLGSTAEEIVRLACCPVLTIHPSSRTRLDEVRTIVVPIDFSDDALRAVDAVTRLLWHRAGSARIVLVHAYQLPAPLALLEGYFPIGSMTVTEGAAAVREAMKPTVEKVIECGFAVEVVVREGNPAAVVTELAEERGADLIAMGTRGLSGADRMLLGSTTERVVQHASCPVLTAGY